MARVDLPSGAWVEYRDKLKAGDKFAVQDAVSMETREDGSRKMALGLGNDIRNALLGRIITGWSYPDPVPAQNQFQAADVVIGNAMDIDDYLALAEAVQPLLDKVNEVRKDPKKQQGS